MFRKIVMLSIILISVSVLLTGCKKDSEYQEITQLRDTLVTSRRYTTEFDDTVVTYVRGVLNELAKATRVGILEKAQTDMNPEIPEVEWFALEEGDDDSMFHVSGQAPFYEYVNEETGNLLLTLYYDEHTKEGRGIFYYSGTEPERTDRAGFIFRKYKKAKEPYHEPERLTYEGEITDEEIDQLINRQEEYKYDEKGNVISYHYAGYIAGEKDENYSEEDSLVQGDIQYSYREDGTLLKKEGMEYGAYFDNQGNYFDRAGREIWAYRYRPHGAVQSYFIYDGEEMEPVYCFVFDPGWDAYMMEY